MSDLSIIAHDYALNAEFARKFNEAVLNLKRRDLLKRTVKGDAEAAVGKSRDELRAMLDSLLVVLEDEGKPWSADQAKIPADVVEAIRKRVKGDLPETIDQLRRVTRNLTSGSALDEQAFAVLDKVCEAADATASAAFRRLRRI
ncbi:MAG: hypothetical protein ABSA83_20630 [Verrucomicrobiota bacterium]|jgi:hypothetical protein